MRGYFTDDEDMDSWKTSLETRITSPGSLVGKPRRQPGDGVRGPGRRGAWNDEGDVRSRHGRPRKSQQELDAELDAFLNERE